MPYFRTGSADRRQASRTRRFTERRGLPFRIAFQILVTALWGVPAVSAQGTPCDNSLRLLSVPKFHVTYKMQGSGSGTNSVSTQYSRNESVLYNQVVTGSFGYWTGTGSPIPWFVGETYSYQNGDTETVQGSGDAPTYPQGGVFFTIDSINCTYTLGVGAIALATDVYTANGPPQNITTSNAVRTLAPATNFVPPHAVPLPSSGLILNGSAHVQEIAPVEYPISWDISWEIAPDCPGVTPPLLLWQGAAPWGGQEYDHSGATIGALGCAMTSMIMAMACEGFVGNRFVTPDPGSVNSFMLQKDGDFNGPNVNWDAAVRDLSQGLLKFDSRGGMTDYMSSPVGARFVLDTALCGVPPRPVIVGVKHCSDQHGKPKFPCHFVLVTSKNDDDYMIADPAYGQLKPLFGTYGHDFTTRGTVKDPPGDISALNLAIDQNASMMVTDADGHQTGMDPATGTVLQQIPQSAYFVDQLQDAAALGIDNPVDATASSHILQIGQPRQATYHVVVNGTDSGPFTLTIRAFNQVGGAQTPILVSGNAQPGSVFTQDVVFNPTSVAGGVNACDLNNDQANDIIDIQVMIGEALATSPPLHDLDGDGRAGIVDVQRAINAVLGRGCQG